MLTSVLDTSSNMSNLDDLFDNFNETVKDETDEERLSDFVNVQILNPHLPNNSEDNSRGSFSKKNKRTISDSESSDSSSGEEDQSDCENKDKFARRCSEDQKSLKAAAACRLLNITAPVVPQRLSDTSFVCKNKSVEDIFHTMTSYFNRSKDISFTRKYFSFHLKCGTVPQIEENFVFSSAGDDDEKESSVNFSKFDQSEEVSGIFAVMRVNVYAEEKSKSTENDASQQSTAIDNGDNDSSSTVQKSNFVIESAFESGDRRLFYDIHSDLTQLLLDQLNNCVVDNAIVALNASINLAEILVQ